MVNPALVMLVSLSYCEPGWMMQIHLVPLIHYINACVPSAVILTISELICHYQGDEFEAVLVGIVGTIKADQSM